MIPGFGKRTQSRGKRRQSRSARQRRTTWRRVKPHVPKGCAVLILGVAIVLEWETYRAFARSWLPDSIGAATDARVVTQASAWVEQGQRMLADTAAHWQTLDWGDSPAQRTETLALLPGVEPLRALPNVVALLVVDRQGDPVFTSSPSLTAPPAVAMQTLLKAPSHKGTFHVGPSLTLSEGRRVVPVSLRLIDGAGNSLGAAIILLDSA